MQILIVDDNADALLPLRMLLEASGHTIHVASNVAEGKALASTAFDAVLCDLRLPDGSGNEVAEAFAPHPRLVAMTGMERDAVSDVFTHYLRKPLDFDALLRLLA